MSVAQFLWSWDRGGRWAMVALEPGDLPADADLRRYVDAAAGLEAVGRSDDAARAYARQSQRWPDAPLPWLGLANVAYGRDDLVTAQWLYEEALARDPGDIAARNNRAESLLHLGCRSAAATRDRAGAGSRSRRRARSGGGGHRGTHHGGHRGRCGRLPGAPQDVSVVEGGARRE